MHRRDETDEALVEAYLRDDRKAWKAFWLRYQRRIAFYPGRFFCLPAGEAVPFFQRVLDRLEHGGLLAAYTPLIPFRDWFALRLKGLWYEHAHERRAERRPDSPARAGKTLPASELLDRLRGIPEAQLEDFPAAQLLVRAARAFSSLAPEEALHIKLDLVAYVAFLPAELARLADLSGLPLTAVLARLATLRGGLGRADTKSLAEGRALISRDVQMLHRETGVLLLRRELVELEREHTFDFGRLGRMETLQTDLARERAATPPFDPAQHAALLARPTAESLCGAFGLALPRFQRTLAKAYNALESALAGKRPVDVPDRESVAAAVRLFALEERAALFARERGAGCADQTTLSGLVSGTVAADQRLEKHLARCPACAGTLQYLADWHSYLEEDLSRLDLPREIGQSVKRAVRRFPPREPSLYVRSGPDGIAKLKDTLATPSNSGPLEAVAEEYEADEGRLVCRHLHHKLVIRLSLSMAGGRLRLDAAGMLRDGRGAACIFVLLDGDGQIAPQESGGQGTSFTGLGEGNYVLSVLMPSPDGVVEQEKILLVVLAS